ncbi:MAG: ABC transporter ATP-binding protein [Synergistales bacterium]|nr:ABC transporter ATP-binding protein [Synergistales bacterium]
MNSSCNGLFLEDLAVTFTSKRSGKVDALKGVSLKMRQGDTFALVGESGSGKTTLLRIVLGLLKPVRGKVCLLGEDLDRCTPEDLTMIRRQCGYIPQDPYGCLPPTLNVMQSVIEPCLIVRGRKNLPAAKEKARQLLREVGLDDPSIWNSRVWTTLSGGQRQRVSIARALVLEPLLLLADEPTSMQDASTRGEIIGILKRHVQRGMSLIFVTHDLFLARAAAERILVLYRGLPCEEGPSDEIVKDPLHPYTRALLAASPRLGEKITSISREGPENGPADEGCPFRFKCPEAGNECTSAPPLRELEGRKVACWKVRE